MSENGSEQIALGWNPIGIVSKYLTILQPNFRADSYLVDMFPLLQNVLAFEVEVYSRLISCRHFS